jgi:G6PDH family F420-dependent oxidoreductase
MAQVTADGLTVGYAAMLEQFHPTEAVELSVHAEAHGFSGVMAADHYQPWVPAQGQAAFVWNVLTALGERTTGDIGPGVTAPTFRWHPAMVAQASATLAAMYPGRHWLGLGSGEALNEHIVGTGWPGANIRQERFVEAVHIIRDLFDGGYVSRRGEHYTVDSAKLWDLPEQRVPIGIAVSGKQSCELFAPLAEVMVGIEPDPELGKNWDAARTGAAARKVAQLPISWDAGRDAAVERAHRLFRWSMTDWKVNAELPSTAGFSSASQTARPEDVAGKIPCGNDIDAIVTAAREFFDAGYTDLALVQIGDDVQGSFLQAAEGEILPALRG